MYTYVENSFPREDSGLSGDRLILGVQVGKNAVMYCILMYNVQSKYLYTIGKPPYKKKLRSPFFRR